MMKMLTTMHSCHEVPKLDRWKRIATYVLLMDVTVRAHCAAQDVREKVHRCVIWLELICAPGDQMTLLYKGT